MWTRWHKDNEGEGGQTADRRPLPFIHQTTKHYKMSQLKIIKLTNTDGETILVGVESIISAKPCTIKPNGAEIDCTKIESRGAMITTNWVKESIEEIWQTINQ